MKKRGIWIFFVVVIFVGLIYFFFNPNGSSLFPKCPFHVLTGLNCPGCGSQRAIYSLLHGNFTAAFHYNALLIISLPIVAVLLYGEFNRNANPKLYSKLNNIVFIWIYFAIVVAWWIGRNIFGI